MFDDGTDDAEFEAGLMIGIAIGATIALFYAPASGDVMRRRLDTTFRRLRNDVTERYLQIERDVCQQIDQVQQALEHVTSDIRQARHRLLGAPATPQDS
ncbi:MAG: YtxH domain-containing protein [Acidobacteria bacterium]|nr:YtxH domain-containing protein [Acidobacteriota bacterium]